MVVPHGLGRNFMNLLLRYHGGASWFKTYNHESLLRSHGGASWFRT